MSWRWRVDEWLRQQPRIDDWWRTRVDGDGNSNFTVRSKGPPRLRGVGLDDSNFAPMADVLHRTAAGLLKWTGRWTARRTGRWTAGELQMDCRGTAAQLQVDCRWTATGLETGLQMDCRPNGSMDGYRQTSQASTEREDVLEDESSDSNLECATCRWHFKSSR